MLIILSHLYNIVSTAIVRPVRIDTLDNVAILATVSIGQLFKTVFGRPCISLELDPYNLLHNNNIIIVITCVLTTLVDVLQNLVIRLSFRDFECSQ